MPPNTGLFACWLKYTDPYTGPTVCLPQWGKQWLPRTTLDQEDNSIGGRLNPPFPHAMIPVQKNTLHIYFLGGKWTLHGSSFTGLPVQFDLQKPKQFSVQHLWAKRICQFGWDYNFTYMMAAQCPKRKGDQNQRYWTENIIVGNGNGLKKRRMMLE